MIGGHSLRGYLAAHMNERGYLAAHMNERGYLAAYLEIDTFR